jgi:hypothetical protein
MSGKEMILPFRVGSCANGIFRCHPLFHLSRFARFSREERPESLKPFLENSLGIRWELVQLFFEGFFKTGEQSVS